MIHVSVNGVPQTFTASPILQNALQQWQQQQLIGERYAVAINGEFVSQRDYGNRRLYHGDTVDIVQAVAGG